MSEVVQNDLPVTHELAKFIEQAPPWMRPDAIVCTGGSFYDLIFEVGLVFPPDVRASGLRKNIQQYRDVCNTYISSYRLPTKEKAILSVGIYREGISNVVRDVILLPQAPGPAEQSSFTLMSDPPINVADDSPPDDIPETANTAIPDGITQLPSY